MFNNPDKYVFASYPLASPSWSKWTQYQQDTMQQALLGRLSIGQLTDRWETFWKDAGL